jgi:hypothetical protein
MPSDPRDYQLDLSSTKSAGNDGVKRDQSSRPFLSVLFNCCRVYVRVYRSADATHYAARCPKCGKSVRFEVSDGGSASRSFVVE